MDVLLKALMTHSEAKGSGRMRARAETKWDHDVLRHYELGEKTLLPAVLEQRHCLDSRLGLSRTDGVESVALT